MKLRRFRRWLRHRRFPGSVSYWEANYASGGNSGAGSYGKLADFKAEVLNEFVQRKGIRTVIEFGCGDGNQLSLATYPQYVGLDVSPRAAALCGARFADDSTKSFYLYDSAAFFDSAGLFRAELALSLDVLFHVVEADRYRAYLDQLLGAAEKYAVIYALDEDRQFADPYSNPRKFTRDIAQWHPEWRLVEHIPNRWPVSEHPDGSWSDFYFFEREPRLV